MRESEESQFVTYQRKLCKEDQEVRLGWHLLAPLELAIDLPQ